jgi:AcrR family transcriptional regulator
MSMIPGRGKKTTDRRIQRTRGLLQEALVELIMEKGYEAITIQDILDRANVGRSTFYEHFYDKDDLLLSGFENLRADFEQYLAVQATSDEGPWQLSLSMFRHAEEHRQLYQAMAGRQGGRMAVEHIQGYLTRYLYDHLKQLLQRNNNMPADVLTQFVVSAFIGLLTWWLDNKSPYTAQQMNAFFRQLVEPGVSAYIRAVTASIE